VVGGHPRILVTFIPGTSTSATVRSSFSTHALIEFLAKAIAWRGPLVPVMAPRTPPVAGSTTVSVWDPRSPDSTEMRS
jgi:hypothetical protein